MTDQTERSADTRRGTMEKTYQSARHAVGRAVDTARDAASHAADSARGTAGHAYETTQKTARDAARRVSHGAEENPLAVLAGGIALGLLAGAAIPKSDRERELLAPIGKRLKESVSGAAQAAKDAGKAELDGLGLNRDAANDQVGKLIGGVLQALSAAGDAAANKATPKAGGG